VGIRVVRLRVSPARMLLLVAVLHLASASWTSITSAAQPNQSIAPQSGYSTSLLAAINAYRTRQGLAEIAAAPHLDVLAVEHSTHMAQTGRLNHDGYRERGMRADSPACVENVGWNYATPDAQLRAWIASPGHNRNMLDPAITKAGIGKANGYVTFMACR
jgi:uncharacterized protein YkwD